MTIRRRFILFCLLPSALCFLPVRAADDLPTTNPAVADLVLRLRHGSPQEQERAADDLQLLLGDAAGRVFASSLPDAEWLSPARGHLRAALVGWRTADPARYLLDNPEPDAPARALAALNEAIRTDPAGFASLDRDAVTVLVNGLEELARTDPISTPAALQVLGRIAADACPGVWLLDRARAARLVANTLIANAGDPVVLVRAAIAVAAPDTPVPGPAADAVAETIPPPPRAAGPAERVIPRPVLIARIAADVAYGQTDGLAQIKGNDADTRTFLRAVADRLGPTHSSDQNLNLIRGVREVERTQQFELPAALRDRLCELLVPPKQAHTDEGPLKFLPAQATPDQVATAAAELLTAGPVAHAQAQDTIVKILAHGQPVSPEVLQALKFDPRAFAPRVAPHLKTGSLEARRATAAALATVGVPADDAPTRAALDACLRSDDDALRTLAADALDTPRARDLARLPTLLRDLRGPSPARRSLAARQIQSLNVEPPDVTAALVRATDARDMPAREGLCLALERAFATAHPTREVLATLAAPTNPDPTTRAYAKAALRTIAPQP